MASDLNEAKLIIKNIFIVILAKDEGQFNNENIPSEDAKLFFVKRFSHGVQQSIVNSVLNLEIENDDDSYNTYVENNDTDQEDDSTNEIKNWILNILSSAKELTGNRGSRDNLMYIPILLTPFKKLCYKLPLWSSIMCNSFGYGNLTASSAIVESHINELKNRSGIEKNIRVDDFVKFHSLFLEGSMKLASGLRYFQDVASKKNDEIESHPSELESTIMQDLNEVENWFGKGQPEKIKNLVDKEKSLEPINFGITENDTNSSDNSDAFTGIEPLKKIQNKIGDKVVDAHINLEPPVLKKKSKYLNPDSECLTIPLENVSTPSKMGLLPNGGTFLGSYISSSYEGKTINLSNTCGFDSLLQLFGVAYCDSVSLCKTIEENNMENQPEIHLAIELTKQNNIGKAILNSRFKILNQLFPSVNLPNNVVRINCDCNVVEVLQKLSVRTVRETKTCSNHGCPKKITESKFPTILLHFKGESIRLLQQKLNEYTEFQSLNKYCTQQINSSECNGHLFYEHLYGPLCLLSFSCMEQNGQFPNEYIICLLQDIPNIIVVKSESMMLRGVIGYKPPLTGTAALGHYVCYAKRSHLYWEVHDDLNKTIKSIRSSSSVKVVLILYTK